MFTSPAFIKMGLVSCPIGAYMGILWDSYFTSTATTPDINKGPIRYGLMRLGAGIIVFSPIATPYFFLEGEYSVYTLYLLKTSLPFFLLTFLLFAFGKVLFLRLGIQ